MALPQGSKYASDDQFQELQEELFRFCNDAKNTLIFGDFNATGELHNFVRVDECLSDRYGLEDVYNENTDIFKCLELYNIPLTRKSLDKIISTYGHSLLDMCRNTNLFILNGNVGADRINTINM